MPEPGGDGFAAALGAAFAAAGLPAPEILALRTLSGTAGGPISRAFRLKTRQGVFFCKWNPEGPADLFHREKEGLEALAGTGTSLRIPRVTALSPEDGVTPPLLVMEYLEPSAGGSAAWEKLGTGLAELHRHASGESGRADRFGFFRDNYCGLTVQENDWSGDWAEFYSRRRIGALLARLEKRGAWPLPMARDFAKLLDRLPALLGHRPAASLIHGDLWSGNFLASARGPALIDPAAHFADREAEWGMILLFGGFPGTVLDAYQEAWSLPPGWRERIPLYQLYHLLNHFLLFGGSYGERAWRTAKKYL